jgi:hypothetical protein
MCHEKGRRFADLNYSTETRATAAARKGKQCGHHSPCTDVSWEHNQEDKAIAFLKTRLRRRWQGQCQYIYRPDKFLLQVNWSSARAINIIGLSAAREVLRGHRPINSRSRSSASLMTKRGMPQTTCSALSHDHLTQKISIKDGLIILSCPLFDL